MTNAQFVGINFPFPAYESFAIWDIADITNLNVINPINCGMLKRHVVILGEGGGGFQGPPELFRNFHARYQGGRDSWLLQAFFQDSNIPIPSRVLSGAFMTDMDKGNVDKLDDLLTELKAIGFQLPTKSKRIIIGIGKSTYDFLNINLDELNTRLAVADIIIRHIPHFARHGIEKNEFINSVREIERDIVANGWLLY